MWKQYKKPLILSSLAILLPTLIGLILWNRLPELIPTHWGMEGPADSYSSKAFAVFGLPLILLGAHWLCLWATSMDPKNKGKNRKGFLLFMWIIPLISNFIFATIYATAMGWQPNISAMVTIPIGLMFVAIGNYMPKLQQNHTMGIKIHWTLGNEENWNLTHRFAGKCWVIGGLLMLFSALVPENLVIWSILFSCFALVAAPIVYSYRIYRRHKQQGIEYTSVLSSASPKTRRLSILFLILTLVFICWIMFTGDIVYAVGEDALTIEADFHADFTVSYESIDSMEFREGNMPGTRIGGFASARLLMGTFRNKEFGNYTRYTYTNPDGCIVLRSGQKVLVISTERYSETLKLYLQLLEKVPRP